MWSFLKSAFHAFTSFHRFLATLPFRCCMWQPWGYTARISLKERASFLPSRGAVSRQPPAVKTFCLCLGFHAEAMLFLGSPLPMTEHSRVTRMGPFLPSADSATVKSLLWISPLGRPSLCKKCTAIWDSPYAPFFLSSFLSRGSEQHHGLAASPAEFCRFLYLSFITFQ